VGFARDHSHFPCALLCHRRSPKTPRMSRIPPLDPSPSLFLFPHPHPRTVHSLLGILWPRLYARSGPSRPSRLSCPAFGGVQPLGSTLSCLSISSDMIGISDADTHGGKGGGCVGSVTHFSSGTLTPHRRRGFLFLRFAQSPIGFFACGLCYGGHILGPPWVPLYMPQQ